MTLIANETEKIEVENNNQNVYLNQTIDFKTAFERIIQSSKATHLRTPLTVHIDTTFRCTQRCIFCYDNACPEYKSEELSTVEFKNVIDQCANADVVQITFGGGEPFIREDFIELFAYTKYKKIHAIVISNGTLIYKNKAVEIARYFDSRFDKIQISLDGSNSEVNNLQRGVKGAFERTWKGIQNLATVGISPMINTVVTRINYHDIPKLIDLIYEKGIRKFRVLGVQPYGRASDPNVYKELAISNEMQQKLHYYLVNVKRAGLHIATDQAYIFPLNVTELRIRYEKMVGREPPSTNCAAGSSTLAIGPDGCIVACSYMHQYPELSVCNIKERPLMEIWNDENIWRSYRHKYQINEVDERCRVCGYYYMCGTSCRIMSYAIHKDFKSRHPWCKVNKSS